MSFVAALLLAAAAAQAAPAEQPPAPDRGAQVETARISATILRPAMIKDGVLVSGGQTDAPHAQRQTRDGRVNYAFE